MLTPTKEQILSYLVIGLKRFRNTVRFELLFLQEKRKKNELENSPLSQNTLVNNFSLSNENDESNGENNNANIITSKKIMNKK